MRWCASKWGPMKTKTSAVPVYLFPAGRTSLIKRVHQPVQSSPNNIICLRFRELLRLLLNGTRSVHLLAWWDAPFRDRTFGWFFTRSEARKDADSEMITIRSMRSNGGWQTSSFLQCHRNEMPCTFYGFVYVRTRSKNIRSTQKNRSCTGKLFPVNRRSFNFIKELDRLVKRFVGVQWQTC